MFSNLTQGSSVYILSTKDKMKYHVCQVEMLRPSFSYTFNNGAVVDIAVTIDGQRKEFAGIAANSSVSTSQDYIITDSKEAMISQIENLLQTNKDIVDNIDRHKSIISECEEILKNLNPQFAKEHAFDSALNELSSRVDSMQNEFVDIRSDVKRMLNLLTNKNS